MSRSKTLTHEEVGNLLSKLEGFQEGQEHMQHIIEMGHMLKSAREEVGMTLADAAYKIGTSQEALGRIESGTCPEMPRYFIVAQILIAYTGSEK